MKRGKDEGNMTGPMFPRLHVNEIDKRGPRAPPRNKMALYEQLSIPSQRFTGAVLPQNPDSGTADLMTSSSQGGGSEKGMVFSRHLPPKHQSEKQYSQYSDLIASVTHVDKRKELDDDDFRVPIYIHSLSRMEHVKHTDDSSTENRSLSNSSYSNHSLTIPKARTHKEENLKELVTGRVKDVSNSSLIEKTAVGQKKIDLSTCLQTGGDPVNTRERLASNRSGQPELCSESQITSNVHHKSVMQENKSITDKRGASPTTRVLSFETKSCEGGSCMSPQVINLERGDSVSEITLANSIMELEVTPDDVVGVMGQKRFWKARRAIVNQQRVFADQVFELHRLLKVQRSISTSSQFLPEDITFMSKPIKASPGKTLQLDYSVKSLPTISKQKVGSEKPNHKEGSAENTVGNPSLTSNQNHTLPSHDRPFSYNSSSLSDTSRHNEGPMCFNQPHGSHWLIPVMSPSEGLVYKPFPGPAFSGPSCGGWGPPGSNTMPHNNFLTPAYGVPPPYPQYHQFPSFPNTGPHTFFPAYSMPFMGTTSFSGSSIEQVNQPSIPRQCSLGNTPSQRNMGGESYANLHESEHIEVQASTGSSPSERTRGSETGNTMEGRNNLTLFPKSPAEHVPPTRVIKVVPHKAGSVTESVARIFRSIQEERNQHSSV